MSSAVMRNDDSIRQHLVSCGIGRAMWALRLSDLGDEGKRVREYITGSKFQEDVKAGAVITFIGQSSKTYDLFWAFAKEAVLLRRLSVHYLSVRQLINVLRNNSDGMYEYLSRCDLLVVRGLASADVSGSLLRDSYSGYDRNLVEDFLWYRYEGGKAACFAIPDNYKNLTGWGSDLMSCFTKKSALPYGR